MSSWLPSLAGRVATAALLPSNLPVSSWGRPRLQDVRMSPDNLKAFILWDSVTGQPSRLRSELSAR